MTPYESICISCRTNRYMRLSVYTISIDSRYIQFSAGNTEKNYTEERENKKRFSKKFHGQCGNYYTSKPTYFCQHFFLMGYPLHTHNMLRYCQCIHTVCLPAYLRHDRAN